MMNDHLKSSVIIECRYVGMQNQEVSQKVQLQNQKKNSCMPFRQHSLVMRRELTALGEI